MEESNKKGSARESGIVETTTRTNRNVPKGSG